MSKVRIYLAGPISGQSYAAAKYWRDSLSDLLYKEFGDRIIVLDPLRGKDELLSKETKIKHSYEEGDLAGREEIFRRDIEDVLSADLIFVNLPTLASFGTSFELGMAFQKGTPTVILTTEELSTHPFVRPPYFHDWHLAIEFTKSQIRSLCLNR